MTSAKHKPVNKTRINCIENYKKRANGHARITLTDKLCKTEWAIIKLNTIYNVSKSKSYSHQSSYKSAMNTV